MLTHKPGKFIVEIGGENKYESRDVILWAAL